MKKLNILLSVFACHPEGGSEPQIGWSWAASLVDRGHAVWILTRSNNRERIERFLSRNPMPGATFIYLETPFKRLFKNEIGGVYYAAWQLAAVFRARKILKSVPMDIVHHASYGAIQLPTLLCMLGLPTVFGPCGGGQTTSKQLLSLLGPEQRKEQRRTAMISLLPFSPMHRFLMRKTALVLATNEATKRLARRMGCSHVASMLDTGLPSHYCVVSPKSAAAFGSTVRLLWVGRDLPRKGLSLALQAIALAKSPVHLDVIGPSDVDSVLERVKQAGVSDRVTVHGSVPFAELRTFFGRVDCLLFSSLRDSFGSQLLEAAGNGLAIICLDHQGAAEFVTDKMAIRVTPTTPKQTAREMAAAIDHYAALTPAERAAMSSASLEHARGFEWSKRIVDVERFYEQVQISESNKSRHVASAASEA